MVVLHYNSKGKIALMITLTLIINNVGIAKQGLEKLGHAQYQCLYLKVEVLIVGLIFFK